MSGSYGYLLTGVAFQSGSAYYYSEAGSATGDGRGNMSAAGMANASGNTITTTGQGPYSLQVTAPAVSASKARRNRKLLYCFG